MFKSLENKFLILYRRGNNIFLLTKEIVFNFGDDWWIKGKCVFRFRIIGTEPREEQVTSTNILR